MPLPLPLNIYVNGKRRERLVLEAAELPAAEVVRLKYDCSADGPALRSDNKHYTNGAYHFWRSAGDVASPGLYRVNGVTITYQDGSGTWAPTSGDIVIEIEMVAPPAMPPSVFRAR